MTVKKVFTWIGGIVMVAAGLNHFANAGAYEAMVPRELPSPGALVVISGIAEMAGGLGVLHPRTRKLAGWGLILLFLAVFPANINMAVNHLPLGGKPVASWMLWARLPFQLVFLGWAWWMTRDDSAQKTLR